MTASTVWKLETADGAANALEVLERAEKDQLVAVDDHAVLSCPEDDQEASIHHGHDSMARGVGWRLRGTHMKLLETNLTPAERESLLETFDE